MMGAALQTVLEQPPSPIEQTAPAVTGMMVVGMMGAVLPMVLKD